MAQVQSLYDRIGGEAAIMAAVDKFYDKVLSDELTAPFFKDLDMAAQSKKLVAFMAVAFGGPDRYKGKDLRQAHAGLVTRGLTDKHFDRIAEQLAATLQELGVPEDMQQEAIGIVAGTRAQVLGR